MVGGSTRGITDNGYRVFGGGGGVDTFLKVARVKRQRIEYKKEQRFLVKICKQ